MLEKRRMLGRDLARTELRGRSRVGECWVFHLLLVRLGRRDILLELDLNVRIPGVGLIVRIERLMGGGPRSLVLKLLCAGWGVVTS